MTGTISRAALLLAVLIVLLLSGCASFRPDDGLTRSQVASDDVTLRAVLAFARQQAEVDETSRTGMIKALEAEPVTPLNLMKLGILHGQTHDSARPSKGAAFLERLLADTSPDAATLKPLARILHSQYLARVRLEGQNERLLKEIRTAQAQGDAQQEKLESLQGKLNALTDIERSLGSPIR